MKRFSLPTAAFALCFLTGCYEQTVRGDESVYRFAWWLGPVIITVGLLGVPVGWLLRQWNPKLGFVVMVLAPILLIIVAPSMYSDRVVVDGRHFEARYGFWFSPSVHVVPFDDLTAIRYVAKEDHRGRVTYRIHCVHKTGSTTEVSAGDLVRNAVPEILDRARVRGIIVTREGP